MKNSIQLFLFILLIGALMTAIGCKNIKKFKESREELKDEKTEQVEEMTERPVEETIVPTLEIDGDSLLFSYERTPCFGRCPIFKMSIFKSGFATYNGTNFVDYIGLYKHNFDNEVIAELKIALEKADFFNLEDEYNNEHVTDLPARIVEANIEGQFKRVIGRYNMPDEYKELTKTIDKIFENVEWQAHSEN